MKKSRLTTILLILVVPVLYFSLWAGFKGEEKSLINIVSNPPANPPKDFITSIYNIDYFGLDQASPWNIKNHISRYRDSLNFNSIQIWGGYRGGHFDSSINSYKDKVNDLMYSLDTSGLKVLYGRAKINNLCFGQRLEYEAEGGNNGFSYQRRNAEVIPDSGRSVLHPCITNCDASPRILCDSIYENLQHSNIVADFFSVADVGNWYLKPVMRIDTSDFSTTDTRPVIGIFVKNFDGSYGDTIIIRVNNFRDSNFTYNGQYIQNYRFQNFDSLKIFGDTTNGLNKGRDSMDIDDCKIDFKIYWYGQVEVWFDKLIVDDEMGNLLFNADNSKSSCMDYKIKEESTQENFEYIVDLVRNKKFVESNYTCVNYVLNKMDFYLHPALYAQAR